MQGKTATGNHPTMTTKPPTPNYTGTAANDDPDADAALTLALDKAASKYQEQVDGWWDVLRSLAGCGGGADADADAAERMCVCVDRIVAEEGHDEAGNGEKSGNEDDEETIGRRLPDDTQYKVDSLSLRANVALESSSSSRSSSAAASLELWAEAMALVPKERFFLYPSSSSYALLGAADALHRSGRLDAALSSLRLAMFVPGTIGTPYAHYLLGRVKLELGDEGGAEVELGRALYLVDGQEGELFDDEAGDVGADDGEREVSGRVVELARRGMHLLLEEEARYSSS